MWNVSTPGEMGPVDVDAPLEKRTPGGLGPYLVMKMANSIHYEYRDRTSKITFIADGEARACLKSHFNDAGQVAMLGRLDAAQAVKAQSFLDESVAENCVIDMQRWSIFPAPGWVCCCAPTSV